MTDSDLQSRCERGQELLMQMNYLEAEAVLAQAEREAWAARDFDTLSRLYMPLQETRRQRRQRCGEGIVCLDLISEGPNDRIDGRHVVENYPHGQLLVAGWGTLEPAARVRQLQVEHELFVETFLGAVYEITSGGRVVVIAPTEDVRLPAMPVASVDALVRQLPAHCIVLAEDELPRGSRRGTPETYGQVMAMWERLHAPFLAAADMQVDPVQRMEGYRKTIRVDYACELAHQKLSDVAKNLARQARAAVATTSST
jgi:hypothetical protein